MTVEEIWKDIEGYEREYQISNFGRVRSLDKKVNVKNNHIAIKHGKILKLHKNLRYKYIMLSSKNVTKMCRVHILVAKAFVPNPQNKTQVNHINGNKFDNRAENLEWVTAKENMMHAWRNELNKRGEPKEIFQYDKSGNFINKYESAKEASRQTGIDHSNICNAGNNYRGRNTAGGYIWKWGKSLSTLEKEKHNE